MPIKNRVKIYLPDSYYHIYNRGWNRTEIYQDNEDYQYFEWLLSRHLSDEPVTDKKGREFRWLRPEIELNAYCLMPNHFHVLVYQQDAYAISRLMSSILTAYTMYFNKKYHRRGPLFESTFKAVNIISDPQLLHITRYIHLNHPNYISWIYSSYRDYLGLARNWINAGKVLALFPSKTAYKEFIEDYEETQRIREQIKRELAKQDS